MLGGGAHVCGSRRVMSPPGFGGVEWPRQNKNSHAFKHLAHGYEKTLQYAFTNAAFLLIHK